AARKRAQRRAARIGPTRSTLHERGGQAAQGPEDIPGEEAQNTDIAGSEMLRVEESLAPRIAGIEALELLGGAPVIVVHGQGGLVDETRARAKQAVAEVVAPRRLVGPEPLVEATLREHERTVQDHVVGKQEPAAGPPRVVAGDRIVDRVQNRRRLT